MLCWIYTVRSAFVWLPWYKSRYSSVLCVHGLRVYSFHPVLCMIVKLVYVVPPSCSLVFQYKFSMLSVFSVFKKFCICYSLTKEGPWVVHLTLGGQANTRDINIVYYKVHKWYRGYMSYAPCTSVNHCVVVPCSVCKPVSPHLHAC